MDQKKIGLFIAKCRKEKKDDTSRIGRKIRSDRQIY